MTPLTTGGAPEGVRGTRANVFSLVAVVLLTLVAFSAFFIGFLLAPLAVLLFFSLIFYSRDRSAGRRRKPSVEVEPAGGARSRLIIEARERQAALALEARRSRTYTDVPPDGRRPPRENDGAVPERSPGDTD
jgi:hypothetical protein